MIKFVIAMMLVLSTFVISVAQAIVAPAVSGTEYALPEKEQTLTGGNYASPIVGESQRIWAKRCSARL